MTNKTQHFAMHIVLSRLIKSRGVKQIDVAKAIGVSPVTLNYWTANTRPIMDKFPEVGKLAEYFGVSIEFLLYGNEQDQEKAAEFKKPYIDDSQLDLFGKGEFRYEMVKE